MSKIKIGINHVYENNRTPKTHEKITSYTYILVYTSIDPLHALKTLKNIPIGINLNS